MPSTPLKGITQTLSDLTKLTSKWIENLHAYKSQSSDIDV